MYLLQVGIFNTKTLSIRDCCGMSTPYWSIFIASGSELSYPACHGKDFGGFHFRKTTNRVWNSWVLMGGKNYVFTIRSLYSITWYSLAETNCVVKIVKTAINAQQLSAVSSPRLSLIYLLYHDPFFIKICVLSTSNIHVMTVFNPVNVLVKCTKRVKFFSISTSTLSYAA